VDRAFPVDACPHVAILLSRHEEVAPALASFYALGAKRNGWLYHRSLAGRLDADRAALIAAGLDVAALEADGRMVLSEMEPDISVEDYVHGWDAEMDAALARGFDAVWCSRFPVGPDPAFVERSLEYDRAWDEHSHDRPYVSLCIYVVGDVERDRRAAELAAIHDTVLGP
jgi:MEDS: MEthanogen/methylotroph, DcmR Sensory domain